MIKAIETVYRGYRFRSRLEARWAVFFDGIGLKWEYEHEGFQIEEENGNYVWYLPDFELSFGENKKYYADIKPAYTKDYRPDLTKPRSFAKSSYRHLVICGNPWPREYAIFLSISKNLFPFPTAQFAICLNCSGIVVPVSTLDFTRSMGAIAAGCTCQDGSGIFIVQPGQELNYDNILACSYRDARQARFEHGETP